MDAFQIARIGSDILLAVSVLICAARMFKSGASAGHVRRIQELEGTIRDLIREADSAGQNLQDSLDRRQKNLDRTLTELEAIESKTSKAINQSEEFIRAVDGCVQRAKGDLKEIAHTAQQVIQKTQHEVYRVREDAQRIQTQGTATSVAPSAPRYAAPASPPVELRDEIPEPPSFSVPSTKPALRQKIEREVSVEDREGLEEVFRLAEDLLRAGRDIEYVSARTKLPQEAIATLVTKNSRVTADPRLGALGAMRRVTQTLG